MFTNSLYLGCLLAVSSRPCGLALILSASIHASVPKPHLNFRVHCGSTLLPGQMPHWLTIAAWHIILKLRWLGQYKHLSCHVCRRLGIRMQPGQVVLVQSFSQGCREGFSQGWRCPQPWPRLRGPLQKASRLCGWQIRTGCWQQAFVSFHTGPSRGPIGCPRGVEAGPRASDPSKQGGSIHSFDDLALEVMHCHLHTFHWKQVTKSGSVQGMESTLSFWRGWYIFKTLPLTIALLKVVKFFELLFVLRVCIFC